jgi:tetratricopeptide (TPR) repeat protein
MDKDRKATTGNRFNSANFTPLMPMKHCLILLFICSVVIACREKKQPVESGMEKDTSAVGLQLSELKARIAAQPRQAELYYQRALLYQQIKRLDDAQKDLIQAIRIDSTRADYFLALADIYFSAHRIYYARNALKKALEVDPNNLKAHGKLAEVFFILKKYDESMTHTTAMLKLSPGYPLAYFIRGMIYKETGDTPRALSAFQSAIESDADYYQAHMQLGVLFQIKNNPVCLEYFNHALRIRPESEEALYGRAMYLQENNELDKAIQDYTQILKLNPRHKHAHFNLGYIHYTYLQEYRQAIRHYSDAIACDPAYAEAYFNRGLCYEMTGNLTLARADYEKALQLRPGYQLPQEALQRIAAIPDS